MANKYVIVKMANGERYRIPFSILKKNWDDMISELPFPGASGVDSISDELILEWACRMSWDYLDQHATKLPNDEPNHQFLWESSEKTVVKA